MASVRASLMTQARAAAKLLDGHAADVTTMHPVVEQLVRRAQLSQDAAHALDWALHTLDAHGDGGVDRAACLLLRTARAHLDTVAGAVDGSVTRSAQSLAWH